VSEHFDILVIGAGPAGIAAATRAAECGKRVGMVDDNFAPGGQIWRGTESASSAIAVSWYARLANAQITKLQGWRIFSQPALGVLRGEKNGNGIDLAYDKLILATGARERFLPFPGWTLLNVLGAGALQALVKSGLPIEGKRVIVAGSGPLLLAVAAYLAKHGASIAAICEQASSVKLATFATSLVTNPEKLQQALAYRFKTRSARFHTSCWPVVAHGQTGKLESVTLRKGNREWTIPCDYLACGFHLVPNTELPELLGCAIASGNVKVDEWQATSISGIYCAGEPTGIGGLELSLIEGEIAGYAAAGQTAKAAALRSQRNKLRRFAKRMEATFVLNPALRQLPKNDTLICRCEDVALTAMAKHSSWRAAKLQTRCGMGPCQGRVCGPAAEFLFHWRADSIRPPIFPTPLYGLASSPAEREAQIHTA
jgi:NADPH-dependent 2,4-dienoyl-CoA reductase/sulfur reductase-like enzyme